MRPSPPASYITRTPTLTQGLDDQRCRAALRTTQAITPSVSVATADHRAPRIHITGVRTTATASSTPVARIPALVLVSRGERSGGADRSVICSRSGDGSDA